MAQYIVTFDRNVTKTGKMLVEAESEEQAKAKAEGLLEGSHLESFCNPFGLTEWEYGERTWHSVEEVEPVR